MTDTLQRPDIECPRWKIQVYDEEAISPGYWFVSPYEKNGNKLPGGSWIGPHIYDGSGELVWSGTDLFDHINVMDFKVQNWNGTDMLSMLFAVEGKGIILDKHYRIVDEVDVGITGETFNMHDFRTIEDGSHYLYLQRNVTTMSREKSIYLGYKIGLCQITYPGFQERDVQTGEVLFTWSSRDHIPFSDSTMNNASITERCNEHWDYLHSNAIDKFYY